VDVLTAIEDGWAESDDAEQSYATLSATDCAEAVVRQLGLLPVDGLPS
jgi:hypothetical protein